MDGQKAKNLYSTLINDQKTIFHATDRVTKDLIKKARTSLYPKDKVFVKNDKEIGNKKTSIINEKPPLNTPFCRKT